MHTENNVGTINPKCKDYKEKAQTTFATPGLGCCRGGGGSTETAVSRETTQGRIGKRADVRANARGGLAGLKCLKFQVLLNLE